MPRGAGTATDRWNGRMIRLTDVLGLPLVDTQGTALGRLVDIVVREASVLIAAHSR